MDKLPRILLAEDNPEDIELILAAFREINLVNKIFITRNGEELLDYLCYRGQFTSRQKGYPAVILMDLKMPKIDGLEALKIIKSDPDLKIIPVVILTSSSMESDLIKSYHLGVNAYVVKPVNFDQFVLAIKEIGLFWAILNQIPSDHYQK